MRPLFQLLLVDPRFQALRYRSALLFYAAILIMGSIPGARAEVGQVASGLMLHTLAYAGLAVLLFSGSPGTAGARAAKAVLTVVAMGAVDEIVQSFFPYRHASVIDWAVDCNAAVLSSALLWRCWPKRDAAG